MSSIKYCKDIVAKLCVSPAPLLLHSPPACLQLMNLINGKVAMDRVQSFMGAAEIEQRAPLAPASQAQPAVEVHGCSFAWQHDGAPLLHNVDLSGAGGAAALLLVHQCCAIQHAQAVPACCSTAPCPLSPTSIIILVLKMQCQGASW